MAHPDLYDGHPDNSARNFKHLPSMTSSSGNLYLCPSSELVELLMDAFKISKDRARSLLRGWAEIKAQFSLKILEAMVSLDEDPDLPPEALHMEEDLSDYRDLASPSSEVRDV